MYCACKNTKNMWKTRCSPPGYPPRHLLIIVNWSVNWYACIQRSTCTSCRIQSHANPILWTEKALIHLRWHATASRQCIGVVNKTPRRSTTCITSTTVNRVVAECTKFITHWSLWWKNSVDWIKNGYHGNIQWAIATQFHNNHLRPYDYQS